MFFNLIYWRRKSINQYDRKLLLHLKMWYSKEITKHLSSLQGSPKFKILYYYYSPFIIYLYLNLFKLVLIIYRRLIVVTQIMYVANYGQENGLQIITKLGNMEYLLSNNLLALHVLASSNLYFFYCFCTYTLDK